MISIRAAAQLKVPPKSEWPRARHKWILTTPCIARPRTQARELIGGKTFSSRRKGAAAAEAELVWIFFCEAVNCPSNDQNLSKNFSHLRKVPAIAYSALFCNRTRARGGHKNAIRGISGSKPIKRGRRRRRRRPRYFTTSIHDDGSRNARTLNCFSPGSSSKFFAAAAVAVVVICIVFLRRQQRRRPPPTPNMPLLARGRQL